MTNSSVKVKYLLSASYGNDSMALIQWAHEAGLQGVHVVYCDTGWAVEDWPKRVALGEELAGRYGFFAHRIIAPTPFPDLMIKKQGFPNNKYQWCSAFLKALPFGDFATAIDPNCSATVLIGKRRDESVARAEIPELIELSEYHGGRRVWHPLYMHTSADRDGLCNRAGVEILPHRSRECDPCVNANKGDIRRLSAARIGQVEQLELAVGNTFFKPSKHGGAIGIREVHKWACSGRGGYVPGHDDIFGDQGCGSPFGCGL